MRQTVCLLLIVCLLLAGCGKPAEMDKTQIPWVVPSELLGQPIREALQKDWDWWNGLGKDQIYYRLPAVISRLTAGRNVKRLWD